MKKLIVAAVLAGSMVAMADEAAKPAAAAAPVAPVAAAPAAPAPKHGQLTEEQRAELRAKRMKAMAERKAEMEKKAIDIIKKYGLDDEKAKALLKELQEAMWSARRPRPPMKPPAAPAAEAKPVAAPAPAAK